MPSLCISKIFVRAGLQKWHCPDDMLQLRFSLQAPHWHADVRADALHLVAFNLRFGLRQMRRRSQRSGKSSETTLQPVHSFSQIPTTSVRGYERATLLGIRQTNVPPISTSTPIQIQVTSGKT